MPQSHEAGCRDLSVATLCLEDLHRAHVPLYGEERLEVARQLKRYGKIEDRNKLVLSCVRWALKIAHKYKNFYLTKHLFLDLVQEGMTGLVLAADKYNPEHAAGASFSTYSEWWVRQRITRFLVNQLESVRLPAHIAQKVSRLRRIASKLEARLERKPTDEEIVAEGFDPKELLKLRRNQFRGVVSLEEPIHKGESSGEKEVTLKDVIAADDEIATFASSIETVQAREAFVRFLKYTFGERNAEMFALRYGLFEEKEPITLEEIGTQFNLTRERVRQIVEVKIIKSPKLRWFVTSNIHIAQRQAERKPRNKPETLVSHTIPVWPQHVAITVERTEFGNNGNDSRDVVRCGECGLVQYMPKNMHCRKCNIEFRLTDRVEVEIPSIQTPEPHNVSPNKFVVENIGQRIRDIREAHGLTQSALQAKSRVSRSYLSRIESGQMTPSIGTLEKIGNALGVDLKTFFASESVVNLENLKSDPFIAQLRGYFRDITPGQWLGLIERLKAIQPTHPAA